MEIYVPNGGCCVLPPLGNIVITMKIEGRRFELPLEIKMEHKSLGIILWKNSIIAVALNSR